MKYIFFSLLLGIGLILPQNSYADEWSACSGSTSFNGAACKYTSAPINGPNGPVTQEITGFCDRAGGASGSTLFCNKEKNGWKDCFQNSVTGDACELNGQIGVCDRGVTDVAAQVRCNTTKKPTNSPGGSTPSTCGGNTTCNPTTEVCVEQGGNKVCRPNAATSDGKCGGNTTCNPTTEVCVEQGGNKVCKPNSSTPGTPANSGTTPDASSPQSVGFVNPIRFNSIPELIAGIINALLGILGAITVAILVMSGFKYMTSSNPGEVGQALDGIRNAIVGLMIVMGAFLITQYVISALAG